jgi:AraC-like DNA-binding protein
MSDQASRLWQILATGSHSQRIARAIDWLKTHYTEPLRIEELAARVQMSSSSLHHHFRQLTTMSPLQYVKWLRLNEARRLMLSDKLEAPPQLFAWVMKARRNSAVNTPGCSACHPGAISASWRRPVTETITPR